MFLPIASDQRTDERPWVTWGLLALLTFATAFVLWGREPGAALLRFGLVPGDFRPLSLLTYPFVHAGVGHLLINLSYLWAFGGGVEAAVGRARYALLFFGGALVGGGMQWLVAATLLPTGAARTPIVGASAACAALMGLFAWRYYRSRLTFLGLPYRPHVVSVVAIFLAYEMGAGLWGLGQGALDSGVAHWAHIGGFVFGLACARLLGLGEAGQTAYLGQDARRSQEGSDPGGAIRRWETLLARDPDNATARQNLARCWLALGDREQAAQNYGQAVESRLSQNHRAEAALLYAEMREELARPESPASAPVATGLTAHLPPARQLALATALEEVEQFGLAAETFRQVTLRAPDSPEAETALLKVAGLYVHRLNRREEARILLRLFAERHPHSPFRPLAEQLRRAAGDG